MASVLKVDTIKSLAGNEAMTISEAGVASFASPPNTAVPVFHLSLTSGQNITSGTTTNVNFSSGDIVFDVGGYWDSVNFRYQPQVAGYYQFNGQVYGVGTSETRTFAEFFVNNASTRIRSDLSISGINLFIASVSHLVYLNGTTDFIQLRGSVNGTTTSFGQDYTNFSGFLVRAA